MKSRFLTSAALALLATFTACNDATEPAQRVAQVNVSPAGASIEVQQTLQLNAVAKSASGEELPEKAITWYSSDEAYATVSGTGLVTGVAAGTAHISAASEGRRAAVQVEVTEEPAPPPPPPPPPGNPVPEIESLSPSVLLRGSYDETITVRGHNFVAGSLALWNGGTRSTEVVSPTELRVDLQGEDLSAVGTGQIRVFNPAPGGGMSNGLQVAIEPRGLRLQLTPDVVALPLGDTVRVLATVYDEWGVAVPSAGERRFDWVRLDDGIQFETYDAIRDSVRVRLQVAGTHKVIARTIDGLLADTLIVTTIYPWPQARSRP